MQMKSSGIARKLILRISEGDSDALREFYNIYFDKVFQFASYFIKSEEISQEIVSDVFFSIWNNRKKLPGIINFESYLYTVVKNKAFDYLDKLSRKPEFAKELPLGIFSEDSDPEESLLNKELEQVINKSIEDLPDRCKLIFLMAREDGLKYRDIARILSISEKTVNAQMVTAIKKIGNALKAYF